MGGDAVGQGQLLGQPSRHPWIRHHHGLGGEGIRRRSGGDPFEQPIPQAFGLCLLAALIEPLECDQHSHRQLQLQTRLVRADGEVLVLLHVPRASGWTAWRDGRRGDIVTANLAAMGVVVPPGEHEVEWRYAPVGLGVGAALTVLGLAGCAAWAVAGRRR